MDNKYIEIPIEDFATQITEKGSTFYLHYLKEQSDKENKRIKLLIGGLGTMPLNKALEISSYLTSLVEPDGVSRVVISGLTPEIRDIMDLSRRIKNKR